VRKPAVVVAVLIAVLALASIAEAAPSTPSPGDFGLVAGPAAGSIHEPGHPFSLRVRNIRNWTATSVQACASVPLKLAKVVGVGSGGAIRFDGHSGCWIVRQIKPGKTVRLPFDVRLLGKGKGKPHLKIAAVASGGNSNPTTEGLTIPLHTRRQPAGGHHRRKSHHHAARDRHRVSAITSSVPCTAPLAPGIAFVIDDSGSMEISDPINLRAQAIAVGLDQMPDGAVASATTFADFTAPLFGVTTVSGATRPGLKQAAAAGLFDEGNTDYAEAFAGARTQLAEMTTADRKAVVFLSDGAPTDADFNPAVPVDVGGAPVYTIGLGVDAYPEAGSVMARIAANSGGQYFDAQSAGQLQSIFAQIVASLTCNSESVSEAFTLAPGESRSIPSKSGPATANSARSQAGTSTTSLFRRSGPTAPPLPLERSTQVSRLSTKRTTHYSPASTRRSAPGT
jgi:von Willebrand factor type A domain